MQSVSEGLHRARALGRPESGAGRREFEACLRCTAECGRWPVKKAGEILGETDQKFGRCSLRMWMQRGRVELGERGVGGSR